MAGRRIRDDGGAQNRLARTGLVQGRLHAAAADKRAARLAFEMTLDVAQSVAYTSVAEQASRELAALAD